ATISRSPPKAQGPAMWSPRSQNDKDLYPHTAQERLAEIANLIIVEGLVDDVLLEDGVVVGVLLADGSTLACRSVILCSGTFLSGRMFRGEETTVGGRAGEESVEHLSGSLRRTGLQTGRLKTGTPPRIDRRSIDLSVCHADGGDAEPVPFSKRTSAVRNQVDCYITGTTSATHDILRSGLDRSPMFTGRITGRGPRYCPSVEDKIFRFADKESHQVFLEPEGLATDSVYVNGFSTSLPEEIQLAALRTIPGLEHCTILRYGYAVEYDYFPSHQLHRSLESKFVRNLFFAGQVNGTSGYEEAAAQGLIAGINAALGLRGEEPLVLDRSQGYIGVLIDDLVNLTIDEPYRMFTSRAEYRLLLRRDNADLRLTPIGYRLGLVEPAEYERVMAKEEGLAKAMELLQRESVKAPAGGGSIKAWQYLKRPEVSIDQVRDLVLNQELGSLLANAEIAEQADIMATYEGYIIRQVEDIERFRRGEEMIIPMALDYHSIRSLSSEGREKLSLIRPASLGQAARIAGVSRSDIAVLGLYLR
ncbi:MAG: tRNA uridine-5-carboxymethylaminomethyl(34) synthesis enzyme MnmG, partial [Bacteroidota bacterium]